MPPDEKITIRIDLEGNFFKRDPGKTLRANVRDMLDKVAAWMESEVKTEIGAQAGNMPFYTGYSREHVEGYTTSKKTGKRWGTWAAVASVTAGMDAEQAIRTKARVAGRQKGNHGTTPGIERRFHPYRNVKAGVYRSRPILSADLTKGLE